MILLNFGVLPSSTSFLLICVVVALGAGALFGAWLQRHVDKDSDEDLVDKFVKEQQEELHEAITDFRYKDGYERQYWDINDAKDVIEVKEKIRNYCKLKAITQTKLAQRVGISQATVSKLLDTGGNEKDNFTNSTLDYVDRVLRPMNLKLVMISMRKEKFVPKATTDEKR